MPFTEFVQLYSKSLVALFLLLLVALFLIQRYAYVLVTIAAFGSILGLILGFSNPESLRFLFRSKTSKANVCWSFAFLIFLFGSMGASMEPKGEIGSNVAAVPTHSKDVVVKVPTNVSHIAVSPIRKPKSPAARKQARQGVVVPQESKEPAEADGAKAEDGDFHSPYLNPSDDENAESSPSQILPTATPFADENVGWIKVNGVGMRQTGVFLGIAYVVESVQTAPSIGNTQADSCFYIVNLIACNTTKRPASIKTDEIALLDDSDREFDLSDNGMRALQELAPERTVPSYSIKIEPSLSRHFSLVYEAPPGIRKIRIRIPDGYSSPIAAPTPTE